MSIAQPEKELSVFESMAARFDVAARKLNLDDGVTRYLRTSNREILVHFPVIMDNGKLEVFDGYRVQHSIARGPCKGGLRYSPHVTLDEIRGLAEPSLASVAGRYFLTVRHDLHPFGLPRWRTLNRHPFGPPRPCRRVSTAGKRHSNKVLTN